MLKKYTEMQYTTATAITSLKKIYQLYDFTNILNITPNEKGISTPGNIFKMFFQKTSTLTPTLF